MDHFSDVACAVLSYIQEVTAKPNIIKISSCFLLRVLAITFRSTELIFVCSVRQSPISFFFSFVERTVLSSSSALSLNYMFGGLFLGSTFFSIGLCGVHATPDVF